MRSADRLTVPIIGAREDGERNARIRNRRCYGGADWRHLGHAGARRRRRQAGQGKERKRRSDARHHGGSRWENRVKRQHDFDPQSFNSCKRYASARIAAVMTRTNRRQRRCLREKRAAGAFPAQPSPADPDGEDQDQEQRQSWSELDEEQDVGHRSRLLVLGRSTELRVYSADFPQDEELAPRRSR